MKCVGKGAEAELFEAVILGEKSICKKRLPKKYRVPELDHSIRLGRTRKEAKLISSARDAGVRTPFVLYCDPRKYEIYLEKIDGTLLMNCLSSFSEKKRNLTARECGFLLARLHSNGIVHGDFTLANIFSTKSGLVVIDFGLADRSNDLEDFATDIVLFKKSSSQELHRPFLEGYCSSFAGNFRSLTKKLGEVEARGRYVSRTQQ